jgi:hypothetical protein
MRKIHESSAQQNASFYGPSVCCPVPKDRVDFTPRLSLRNTRFVSQWHVVGHPKFRDGVILGTRELESPRSTGDRYGDRRRRNDT